MDADECQEEQELEIEALESIYEDDMKMLTNEHPAKFVITILPVPGGGDEENHVCVDMEVAYTAKYPEQLPVVKLVPKKGVYKKHMEVLDKIVEDTLEENLGDVSIFTVSAAVKEWLDDHNEPEKTMHEQMMERHEQEVAKVEEAQQQEQEKREEEQKAEKIRSSLVPPGTIVTPESFAEWQVKFEAEKKEESEAKGLTTEPREAEKVSPLTGRQIFEQNLILGTEKPGEDGTAKDEKDVFWFNENAYADADEDLPSTSEDDDDDDDDGDD